MPYKNKTHSITITTTSRESFESVLQQAEEAAEGFIDKDMGDGSEYVLNMDHVASAFNGRWGRGEKWDLKYEFTLHYKIYISETKDERMTRNCKGMRLEGPPVIVDELNEMTEEQIQKVAKRLKEIKEKS